MVARAGGQLRMSRILMLAAAERKKDIVGILGYGSGVGTLDEAGSTRGKILGRRSGRSV